MRQHDVSDEQQSEMANLERFWNLFHRPVHIFYLDPCHKIRQSDEIQSAEKRRRSSLIVEIRM
jgi:hypothetical protein